MGTRGKKKMPKKLKMRCETFYRLTNLGVDYRHIDSEKDLELLSQVMYDSYKEKEKKELQDTKSELQQTFEGRYGKWLSQCSYVIENEGLPVSATIITLFEGAPLVAYTFTHPTYSNKGYSTFLLQKSINRLFEQGHSYVYLFVGEDNRSARHLYGKIGFAEMS